jgi:antitoxin component YwqK of YwqJK toxin-antitoxin module
MKNWVIFCVFFAIYGCSSQEEQSSITIDAIKFPNGNVVKVNELSFKDGIIKGIVRNYRPDGKLNFIDEFSIQDEIRKERLKKYRLDGTLNYIDESSTQDEIRTGKITKYRLDNGFLSYTREYRVENGDTVRFGWFCQYYEDGKTLEEKSYWRDIRYGDSYFYHRNGQLETYNAWDARDNVFFVIKKDSLGNTLYEEGLVFSPRFLSNISPKDIKVNEPLLIVISVANPPNTTQKIYMAEKGEILQELEISHNTAQYEYTFDVSGDYVFVTVGELYDEKGTLIQLDSIETKINVGE